MLYFVKNEELRAQLLAMKRANKSIGLVPTMGALHQGHMSLIRTASEECDVVVVSIFVNPLQFNSNSDLVAYPRDLEADRRILNNSCDILFAPSDNFYLEEPQVKFLFELDDKLEGAFRPGHFSGVGIVVAKLLNVVQPDKAYFGLKDLQQFILIKTLVRDLSIQTQIVGCPIIREETGLAMSSRNERLSDNGKVIASNIYKGLELARNLMEEGRSYDEIKVKTGVFLNGIKGMEVEYFDIVDQSFDQVKSDLENSAMAICVAAHVEGVRLIDNIYLRSEN